MKQNRSNAVAISPPALQRDPQTEESLRLISSALWLSKPVAVVETSPTVFNQPICMAFQPIVDLRDNSVFAYEALVRGEQGEGSGLVLRNVTEQNGFSFDNACRTQALKQASELHLQDTPAGLAINVGPNVVYSADACIENTLEFAEKLHFPLSRIILEITEHERARDLVYLNFLMQKFRGYGIRTAIDDFGMGYAGLGMLAEFDADMVKIDMSLVRGLEKAPANCAIIESIVMMSDRLDIQVIAEGVETQCEYETLGKMGIHLMQGYFFARPGLSALPPWTHPAKSWQSLQAEAAAGESPCPPKVARTRRTA